MNNARHIEFHAILIIIGGVAALFSASPLYLVMSGVFAFALMWYRRISNWNSNGVLIGIANATTITRLIVLMAAIIGYNFIAPYVFGLVILAVIIADGIDGYLARKYNLESDFGALFDMETDAFLAATVSTIIALYFDFGMITTALMLVAGYLRYLFVLGMRLLGLNNAGAQDMPYARILAVIYFISLTMPFLLTLPFGDKFQEFGLMINPMAVVFGALCVIGSFTYELFLVTKNHIK